MSQLTNLPSPLSRKPSGVADTVTGAPMFNGGALSAAVGSRNVAVASSSPGISFSISFIGECDSLVDNRLTCRKDN